MGKSTTRYTEFDQWINSDQLRQVRKDMLEGKQIPECTRCWIDEKIGPTSTRLSYNTEFKKVLSKLEITDDYTVDNDIVTFDLRLGNLCNLKCVMCNGNASSQILTEYKLNKEKFDNLKNYQAPGLGTDYTWPDDPSFNEFLNKIKANIRWVKFTGGEPTMIPYVVDFLEGIPDPSIVKLVIVTNATRINQRLLDVLSKFNHVQILASIEGVGEDNDQLRYLSDWQEVEQNILNLKALPNVLFQLHYILQCFSVRTLVPVLAWCDQHRVKIVDLTLIEPNFLHINSVDAEIIDRFKNQLLNTKSIFNQQTVDKALKLVTEYEFNPKLKEERNKYLDTLDSIRDTHLTKLIENYYEPTTI